MHAAPVRAPVVQRGALQVVAAEPDKKKEAKKRLPQPVKRAKLSEGYRMYNKSRKSACATRIKKVEGGPPGTMRFVAERWPVVARPAEG